VIDELAKQVGRQNYYAPSWYCLLAGYGRYPNPGGQGFRPQKSSRVTMDQYQLAFSDHRMQLQQLYQQD
jgi:hypothetical protein